MDRLSGRVFFVTGAAGFVGANVCRALLRADAAVHILCRSTTRLWRLEDVVDRLHVHTADVRDRRAVSSALRKARPDIVYHLATFGAYHYQTEAEEILATNVLGASNVLSAAETVGYELFVNTGSSSEYGFKETAMRESDLLEPNSVYGVSKAAQSLLFQQHARAHDRPIVTLRLASVYGPYEEPTRLIPQLMMRALDDRPLRMVAPNTARDFIYVDDVVETYLQVEALRAAGGEIFNLGSGTQTRLAEVVETLEGLLGRKLTVEWGAMEPRPWDTCTWFTDDGKLRGALGDQARISLEDGLSRCLSWFSRHRALYADQRPRRP